MAEFILGVVLSCFISVWKTFDISHRQYQPLPSCSDLLVPLCPSSALSSPLHRWYLCNYCFVFVPSVNTRLYAAKPKVDAYCLSSEVLFSRLVRIINIIHWWEGFTVSKLCIMDQVQDQFCGTSLFAKQCIPDVPMNIFNSKSLLCVYVTFCFFLFPRLKHQCSTSAFKLRMRNDSMTGVFNVFTTWWLYLVLFLLIEV